MWFNINPIQIQSYIVNITNIHDIIIALFRNEYLNRFELQDEIEKVKAIAEYGSKEDSLKAKTILLRLSKRNEIIVNHVKLKEYMSKSRAIVNRYKTLTKNYKPWIKRRKVDKNRGEKLKLSSSYISIIMDFVPVHMEKTFIICTNCSYAITNFNVSCPKCKFRTSNYESLLPDSRFLKRITPSNYDRSENFKEVLFKFQGKWKKKPSDDTIRKIKEYCVEKRFDLTNVNRREMRKILKITGNTKYYYDVNFIMNELCGTPLPDFGEYEERILDRFNIYKRYFEEYKPKERSNSFRAQYMIFQFASQEGLDPKSSDYFLFETTDVRLECDRVNKYIFSIIQSDRVKENWSFYNV